MTGAIWKQGQKTELMAKNKLLDSEWGLVPYSKWCKLEAKRRGAKHYVFEKEDCCAVYRIIS